MIPPTVGRVVWYHPTQQDPGIPPGDQPLAAIITHVWNARMVNLVVFASEGVPFAKTSVRLAQDDDVAELGQAQWMPYQVGQAKKHEAPAPSASPTHADGQALDPSERIVALEGLYSAIETRLDQHDDEFAALRLASSIAAAPADAIDGASPVGDGVDPKPTEAPAKGSKLKLPDAAK